MTDRKTPIVLRRRLYRRAITVTLLAACVTTAGVSLLAPVPAVAYSTRLSADPAPQVATLGKGEVPATKKPAPAAAKPRKSKKKGKLVGVVNINSASAAELEMLPGVGPTKAERVIAHRAKRGKFRRVKDLRRVKGFGRKSLAKLAPYLTVKGPTTIAVASE